MLSRRACISGLAALALGANSLGCSRRAQATDKGAPSADTSEIRLHERSFDRDHGGPQKVVVLVPSWASSDDRLPLLIALHGRGESHRGLDVGAWAWVRDYWLHRSAARLWTPPLRSEDMQGLASPTELARINESLRVQPWQGLVVACPFTTDILGGGDLDAAGPFASFLADHLIQQIRAEFPVVASREATGIDGVSLGGRMALLAAASRPEVFGAVGTLQAAFRTHEVDGVAARVKRAWQEPVHPQALRILTSHDDPFRPTLERLADALRSASVDAHYRSIAGPHDYAFNRGPGGVEMLLWHDRVLRGRDGG